MGAWWGLGQESRYRDQARVINNGYRDELRDFGCAKLKLSALAWVQSPNALVLGLVQDLGRILQEPAPAALRLFGAPHYELFNELYWAAEEEGATDPLMEAFSFMLDRALEVPSIRLAGELWAAFAKAKWQTMCNDEKPANTAEDILFLSCFVPYCDAAFIDNAMAV